jgi:hypothetical protein
MLRIHKQLVDGQVAIGGVPMQGAVNTSVTVDQRQAENEESSQCAPANLADECRKKRPA